MVTLGHSVYKKLQAKVALEQVLAQQDILLQKAIFLRQVQLTGSLQRIKINA